MGVTHDFPEDLAKAQLALHRARTELAALYARLPPHAVPTPAWTDRRGVRRPASPGWSGDQTAVVDALWERQRELAAFIHGHPFWMKVEAGRGGAGRGCMLPGTSTTTSTATWRSGRPRPCLPDRVRAG